MLVKRDDPSKNGELRGDLVKATLLLTGLGAVYVGWKHAKNEWLIEHGWLPASMRDYWMVYAVVVGGVILWGVLTRLRR